MTMLLTLLTLATVAAVITALFLVMWRERRSTADARLAVVCGTVLALWAGAVVVVSRDGVFEPEPNAAVPPVGGTIGLVLLVLGASLAVSPSLRRLLSSQSSLIRLHLWRYLGALFLILMAAGRLPALFAVPAGIGDILVGAAAPWVAHRLHTPGGERRAIVFNTLGMLDLIMAAGLGMTTTPGPTQLVNTVPSSAVMIGFPMALVPAFLVPLAFTLHAVSLWQLLGGSWASIQRVGTTRNRPRG